MLPVDETVHKGDLVNIPQTVDELKALTKKLGYRENPGGGLDVYNGGYHAWYAPPDWDEAIKDIQSRNLDWVKTEDDLGELIFDVMYEWFLNSSG